MNYDYDKDFLDVKMELIQTYLIGLPSDIFEISYAYTSDKVDLRVVTGSTENAAQLARQATTDSRWKLNVEVIEMSEEAFSDSLPQRPTSFGKERYLLFLRSREEG